jgi:hypothetical protein
MDKMCVHVWFHNNKRTDKKEVQEDTEEFHVADIR